MSLQLGFLAGLEDRTGYLGGYLVSNAWGRPLEFRVSNPVQPSRLQQILYGDALRPYIFADLIGKTLVDKTATQVQIIVTDCRPVLDLRRLIEIPIVWLAQSAEPEGVSPPVDAADLEGPVMSLPAGKLFCHPEFPADKPAACKLLERLPDCIDLAEPFVRIREAIGEARRMGATNRAA
jgi:hypothetical protein